MAHPRFYVKELTTGALIELSREDARHAHGVLRLRVGDELQLFDGLGMEAAARIERCESAGVTVEILSIASISRELPHPLGLIVSLPKGDRQKTLVDMLVQLGVHSLTPLECQRSVAQPTDSALKRLERWAIESSKQCGRNQLMEIRPAVTLDELNSSDPCRLFAHPYGPSDSWLAALDSMESKMDARCVSEAGQGEVGEVSDDTTPRLRVGLPIRVGLPSAQVAIGPEGGFTEDECVLLLDRGWQQIYLGNRILRIETAAVMVAATWAAANREVRT